MYDDWEMEGLNWSNEYEDDWAMDEGSDRDNWEDNQVFLDNNF